MRTRLHHANAAPHGLVSNLAQTPGLNGWCADVEHAARVSVKAVLDHGDVDVDDVARLELLVTRDAVAHDMVDRSADRRGVWLMPRRRIVERGGHRGLNVDHVVVAQPVELTGGDAG